MTNKLSTRNFVFHEETKTFAAEMSELPSNFNSRQIYPDASDAGFTLVSEKTGCSLDFVECNYDKDPEGGLAAIHFELAHKKNRKKHGDLKVILFND